MNALFLTLGASRSASARYRVFQHLPHLEEAGIRATVRPLPPRASATPARYHLREVAARLRHIREANRYDCVFVQKQLTSINFRGLDRLLCRRNRRLVYDFDDAVHLGLPIRFGSPALARLQDAGQVRRLATASACTVAGNSFLAGWARDHARRVIVIPTAIDTDRYDGVWRTMVEGRGSRVRGQGSETATFHQPSTINHEPLPPRRPGREAMLVWIGSRSTNRYLNLAAGAVSAVAARRRVGLRVISRDLEGIDVAAFGPARVELRTWSEESELRDLSVGDVGLMPLPDDAWARGKCALKALQYMALGIPVLASGVGAITEIVEDGVNGFLAGSGNEWTAKLEHLLSDAELRRRIGAAGRETVRARYSLRVQGPRLAAVLCEAGQPLGG